MRLTILAATLLMGTAALAQNTTQPRDPNMPDPRNTLPEQMAPGTPGATSETGGNLSERLERSEGVIRPPADAAPDMRVTPPVPNPGTTPVIPPPGEPGGNQAIQPR